MNKKLVLFLIFAAFSLVLCMSISDVKAAGKPNIVLVLMDNFGWGEL